MENNKENQELMQGKQVPCCFSEVMSKNECYYCHKKVKKGIYQCDECYWKNYSETEF